MKILLTGDNGFVGQYVQEKEGVVSLRLENSEKIDLLDPSKLQSFFKRVRPSDVIHLAAKSHVPTSFVNPRETFEVNFFGTLNLLEALKKSGFTGRFLYVGSSEVYGLVEEQFLPAKESHLIRPRSPYAVSKVAAENLCYQWSQSENFEIVLARPFTHIGPRQHSKFAISNFAKQIVSIKKGLQEPIIFVGNLDVTRDFTDVRDIVEAYFLLLEKGGNGEVYNICSGKERSLKRVLDELLDISGVRAEIQVSNELIRPVEQMRHFGSFEKLHLHTKWEPKIPFDKTLKDILEYWERELK